MVSLASLKARQGEESFDFAGLWVLLQSTNQLRRRKQQCSVCCAVYPGLACLALRHWKMWLSRGPGQPQSAGLAGWKLLFCQLLHSLTPGGRIPGNAGSQPLSAETGSPWSFQPQHIATIPLTVCRWPSASECTTCCSTGRALSVTGNGSPHGTTQQHWAQERLD